MELVTLKVFEFTVFRVMGHTADNPHTRLVAATCAEHARDMLEHELGKNEPWIARIEDKRMCVLGWGPLE